MINNLKMTRTLLNKSQKKSLIVMSLLLIVGMFLEILGLGILLPLITIILDPEKLNFIFENQFFLIRNLTYNQKILWIISIISFVYLIKAIFQFYITHNQNLIIEKLGASLGRKLYKKYLNQDYLFHINRDLSEIIKNTQIEINYFVYFCRAVLILFVEFALTISILFTIFYIEPLGAIIIGLFFGFLSLIYFKVTKKRIEVWGNERQNFDKNISKIVLESLSGIKDLKLLMNEKYFENIHKKNLAERVRVASNHQTFTQLPRIFLELITVFGLFIFIALMFIRGYDSTQILTILGVFIAAVFRMIPSINRMLSSLQNTKYYSSSVSLIYREFKNQKSHKNRSQKIKSIKFSKLIKIQNLNFSFCDNKVLYGINLEIKKGETIGFFGPSGSGKSTLIDLINGLLTPSSGNILIDDIDITQSLTNWSKNIGYVGQDIFLIDDTILNNIAFGVNQEHIDIKKVNNAIRAAQLEQFILSIEDGLNTKVGERGIQLSGGQKQRIGIARALYNNPDLLILDEATASLDNKTEEDLMHSIYNLKGKKTLIMIAHRLTTLKKCDKIFEINNGNLIPIKKRYFLNQILK